MVRTTSFEPAPGSEGHRAVPTGVLIVNLGTPEAPRTPEVRRFLREFLSDPRVIDIPAVPRSLLLHLIILPFRPARAAAAYRKIWTERGSPLLAHGEDLEKAMQDALGPGIPSCLPWLRKSVLAAGLAELERGVDRVVVPALPPWRRRPPVRYWKVYAKQDGSGTSPTWFRPGFTTIRGSGVLDRSGRFWNGPTTCSEFTTHERCAKVERLRALLYRTLCETIRA
jgi:hypothetical protein